MDKKTWVNEHWQEFLEDLSELISINSERDDITSSASYPFGFGVSEALEKTLEIADKLGFETTNLKNVVGYAEINSSTEKQVAAIGHADVVGACEGWLCDPYTLTRKDGYLIGRGVIDDKGPLLACLYAAAYVSKTRVLPYSLRIIVGTNEESGMGDLQVYKDHCKDPDFLFTPDGDWPLVYGEKGVFKGQVVSKKIEDGCIIELSGGTASNAVAGSAHARIRVDSNFDIASLNLTSGIKASLQNDCELMVEATGKSAHASTPQNGLSAIGLLARFVLSNNLVDGEEKAFFELVEKLDCTFDGSGVGIDCKDDEFGDLTIICGVIQKVGSVLRQSIDVRFPNSIKSSKIAHRLNSAALDAGAMLDVERIVEPHIVNRDDARVQALNSAYREISGDNHNQVHTVGSGSYAREFSGGVSFGILKKWQEEAPWVGGMHAPNEAVREEDLKEALLVYITAFENLCDVDL